VERGVIAGLAKAIGYPQEVPAEAVSFAFVVDDREIVARIAEGGLEFSCTLLSGEALDRAEDALVRLAGYAAGRLLKEDATLAWDPNARAVVLWMRTPAEGAGDARRAFEAFCTSVDWWSDRVSEEDLGHVGVPETVIRP